MRKWYQFTTPKGNRITITVNPYNGFYLIEAPSVGLRYQIEDIRISKLKQWKSKIPVIMANKTAISVPTSEVSSLQQWIMGTSQTNQIV